MSSDDHATDHAGPPATEVDSDEEEFGGGAPDELHDDALDDKDERWLQQQQREGDARRSPSAASPALNCPLCFTTLCCRACPSVTKCSTSGGPCRRHCIGGDDILEDPCDDGAKVDPQQNRRHSSIQKATPKIFRPPPAGFLRPIMCGSCSTKVAVLDADEVFRFFHASLQRACLGRGRRAF